MTHGRKGRAMVMASFGGEIEGAVLADSRLPSEQVPENSSGLGKTSGGRRRTVRPLAHRDPGCVASGEESYSLFVRASDAGGRDALLVDAGASITTPDWSHVRTIHDRPYAVAQDGQHCMVPKRLPDAPITVVLNRPVSFETVD
jgi:hypothetical protein